MRLWEALRVRKGEVISFVGAGGKTTAMYRLGHELADQGWRVITTTTTMIRPPSPLAKATTVCASFRKLVTVRLYSSVLDSRSIITPSACYV